MAPKQPDWAFLESLSPDDLEDDDTEKVSVTKSSIYSMSIQTTQLDAEGPFSFFGQENDNFDLTWSTGPGVQSTLHLGPW